MDSRGEYRTQLQTNMC
ncbi:hypothetical protein GQ600_24916 [Phytophthora cactorum]|nr:hypothetical protein GQ600_24916 [Phytophthora cactorum]